MTNPKKVAESYIWVARCNLNEPNYDVLRYPFIGVTYSSIHDGKVYVAYRKDKYNYFSSEIRESELQYIISTFLANGFESFDEVSDIDLSDYEIATIDHKTLVGVEQDDDSASKDYVLITITPPKEFLEAFQYTSSITITDKRRVGRSIWMYNYSTEQQKQHNQQAEEEEDDEFDYED
jgi:hypothetical protein